MPERLAGSMEENEYPLNTLTHKHFSSGMKGMLRAFTQIGTSDPTKRASHAKLSLTYLRQKQMDSLTWSKLTWSWCPFHGREGGKVDRRESHKKHRRLRPRSSAGTGGSGRGPGGPNNWA